MWFNSTEKPITGTAALNMINSALMPNVYAALKLLRVSLVTSCVYERSVSALRRMKTYQHSTSMTVDEQEILDNFLK